ncbi:lytic transglycosylase domain-containing protein [Shewanella algae]|nr:lytic transglycosylase domain-containing protein [Shewanella algae]MBO2643614.1 lytic transglycosylase domain-containing protein [Shewanella algae]QXP21303.1 lytic transglycosylase domain-containing protein [Shewanella algae]QXP31812.1 lytic transglycosylase domain-containing protein [Shewanella algae]QXP36310.1 lytic transglycosylase domain-containing protein [Shewanella algae]
MPSKEAAMGEEPSAISKEPSAMSENPSAIAIEPSPKPRIVARYSEHGISDSSLPKRKVYQYRQANGVMAFSDKPPGSQEYQIILYDCFACRPDSKVNWQAIPLFDSDYAAEIALAAQTYNLDPALIRAVIHAESAFNAKALSRTGAMGLMQLMPDTAKELGVSNAFVVSQNIDAGSRYLAQMLARFDGDMTRALAAYNAGPTTVTQYRGVPPYPETRAYVKRVKILLERYRNLSRA